MEEDLLWTYCDIKHPGEVDLLRDPGRAHPATKQSLKLNGLAECGEDGVWRLTPAGQELLARAEAILEGRWQPDPPLFTLPGDFRFRRGAGKPWGLTAAHLKALRALAACPGCTWRSLQNPFGTRILMGLLERGLAEGAPRRGSPWRLTPSGLEVLKRAAGVE